MLAYRLESEGIISGSEGWANLAAHTRLLWSKEHEWTAAMVTAQ